MPFNALADWTKQHPDERMAIGVAVDGSSIGDRALAVAAAFYRERHGDRLVLLHVADGAKTWLPRHLTPRHLESTYVGKAAELRIRAEWACAEKGAASTCEALTALAESQSVGLLVVGSFGRKGEKTFDMLGTVSDYSLRQSNCSVCVVRSTSPPAAAGGGGREYLFATDGSKAAALGFCSLVRQLLQPNDKVLVAQATYDHCAAAASDELFGPYKKLMAEHNVQGECLCWHVPRERRVSEGILELAAARQVNVLVVGISGYGRTKLGSVSEDVTVKAPCDTLVIKDRGDAQGAAGATAYASAGARTLTGMLLPQGAPRGADPGDRSPLSGNSKRALFKTEDSLKAA